MGDLRDGTLRWSVISFQRCREYLLGTRLCCIRIGGSVWERLRVFERVVLLILAGDVLKYLVLDGGRTPILLQGLGIFISVCLVRSSGGIC